MMYDIIKKLSLDPMLGVVQEFSILATRFEAGIRQMEFDTQGKKSTKLQQSNQELFPYPIANELFINSKKDEE